jgi:signal transduction histidine kinase
MEAEKFRGRKILVVDDDTFFLNFLRLVLLKAGFEVFTAENGKDGLRIARETRPEIILSDIMMPEMDGEEFCKAVREDDALRETLFLILTAKDRKEDRIDLLNIGADDYLVKPVAKDELLAKLRAFIRLKDLQNELRRKNEILQKLNQKLQKTTEELRKRNEALKNAQDQLIQSEKMASIGQLAAGIAHEINNPLGYLYGNLNVLKNYIGDLRSLLSQYEILADQVNEEKWDKAKELVASIQEYKEKIDYEFLISDLNQLVEDSINGAERIEKVVASLRDFSSMEAGEATPCDINRILDNALNLVWNEIKYKADVIKEYATLPEILGYPAQLTQVFMNILLNAAQAIEDHGVIRIETAADDGQVTVSITDNGIGIPRAILGRIFDPFFTTKDPGTGSGFGLTVAYNIVKRHQGKIEVESEVGKGTTFRVILPVTERQEPENKGVVRSIHLS